MKQKTRNLVIALAAALLLAAPAYAYDPPAGGDNLLSLYSPVFLSGYLSASSSESPMADLLNPAASGLLQRTTLDASYTALLGLEGETGWGSAVNIGIAVPKPYGVWTGYVGFISSPFASMPLGSVVTGRLGFAKDLYPNLLIGSAVDFSVGSNEDLAWGLAADLGVQGLSGDVGFLKDFRWGFALRNLGMAFKSPGVVGISGSTGATGYDSPFTPAIGVSADLVRLEKAGINLASSVDLWFPTFQNVIFAIGFQADLRDKAYLRFGWDINMAETLEGVGQSLLPSFGIGASFAVDTVAAEGEGKPWDRSEVRPSLAAQKLYDGVWAVGAGVNMPLGVVDRTPPAITLAFPESPFDAYYFSPNNDGTLDELLMPITITDQRYVQGFELKIFNEAGELVRSIANKETRPDTENLSGFFKRLTYVKKGVPVPAELVWNGLAGSGDVVPDGKYFVVLEAVDDNGNSGTTERYAAMVDTTPPTVKSTGPAGADASIFSPDGDGNKDNYPVANDTSKEDLWKADVSDAAGTVIRGWEFKDAAAGQVIWDGKTDTGQVAPDGVYAYHVASTDRAGNVGMARVENIIVNTQQPPVAIAIDLAAFSPNGDGVKDTLTLNPNVPVRAGLSAWTLSVVDAAGAERWTTTGTGPDSLLPKYAFDGKAASGSILPEGEYRTRLVASYVNGHNPTVWSPSFSIDLTPPAATASVDRQAFNPLGDVRAQAVITQSGSAEDRWTGAIQNVTGKAVKTWNFIGQPDPQLKWDGSDDAGKTVEDGRYVYRLSATDRAGNAVSVSTIAVLVDTEKKAVRLSLDKRAFSPNGDGILDSLSISPEVQSAARVSAWTLSIANASGQPVRSFSGTAAPAARVTWDGKSDAGTRAPDGTYLALLEVRYATDEVETARSVDIILDTTPPAIRVTAADVLFSPNGDGRKDSVIVKQASDPGDTWIGTMYNSVNSGIREWSWRDKAADFEWDGTDANGNTAPDGVYRYVVRSEDAAGNKTEKTVAGIAVDNRVVQAFVTAGAAGFSPNGDGNYDVQTVSVILGLKDGVDTWRLAMVDTAGKPRKTWSGKGSSSIPAKQVWDGKGDDGSITQGEYSAQLTVDYLKGDRVEAKSAVFTLDSEGPRVSLTVGPRYFSPDNDGVDDELKIALGVADLSPIDSWRFEIFEVAVQEGAGARKERLFFTWNGRGKPSERLAWDGRSQKGELVEAATDYPYRLTIVDAWGNQTVSDGVISVDVLVLREGDRLKIKVPSIVFRANFADFKDLTPEVLARNEEVLKRIAYILNRFKEYKIRVEGHANSISKMTGASQAAIDKEESGELIPLSTSRADAVMRKLIEFGVDPKRLSVRGLGSSEPVVSFTDAENRWKNRRVEFILIKE
ncbi:MAG: cell envelope biogenesis protein OmpA [Spirochaetales bacterium]|nr:MAG: cell envelope biogenesis protein OmpA [Spirochaetales bacterium]